MCIRDRAPEYCHLKAQLLEPGFNVSYPTKLEASPLANLSGRVTFGVKDVDKHLLFGKDPSVGFHVLFHFLTWVRKIPLACDLVRSARHRSGRFRLIKSNCLGVAYPRAWRLSIIIRLACAFVGTLPLTLVGSPSRMSSCACPGVRFSRNIGSVGSRTASTQPRPISCASVTDSRTLATSCALFCASASAFLRRFSLALSSRSASILRASKTSMTSPSA